MEMRRIPVKASLIFFSMLVLLPKQGKFTRFYAISLFIQR